MLFLILLQSALLLVMIGLLLYWKLQTNRSLERVSMLDSQRSATLRNLQSILAAFQVELMELKEREPAKNEPYPAEQQPLAPASLSIPKRSQALKMIRRGETVETVAAAVGVPQSQIRLLKKVHALIDPAG